MSKSSFCTAVFRAYYGQPERYAKRRSHQRIVQVKQDPNLPKIVGTAGNPPSLTVTFPDGNVHSYGIYDQRELERLIERAKTDPHGVVNHLKAGVKSGDVYYRNLTNPQKQGTVFHEDAPPMLADSPQEISSPEQTAPDWETDPSIPEPGMEEHFSAGAQPIDKYAVKKPRSIFDSLPDLSDPAKYASRKSSPRQGQTSLFEKNPSAIKVDKLPDAPPIGSEESKPASSPSPTAQRSLVAEGESIAPPPTKAPTTVTKTTKARPLSDERRVKGLQDDLGNWFRIHNQDIHGLPPDSAVKLVKYLAHEGRLFRLSHVDHPKHGSFIHVEHGVQSDVPHQGRGTRVELQAISPEAHQAMKYLPKDHPLVKLASEMMYGPKDVTKTTKTGVRRHVGADVDPELARKRASFLASAPSGKGGSRKLEGLKPSPPSAKPPVEGRTPVIGGRADETIHPQLPTAAGPIVTPPQQLNPKTRRFGAFSLSSSTKQFADAVVEKYTQVCREHDLLQRFAAAYYGEVERYGGQQAGHHIDFQGFNNGIPAATMMQPMKLQSAVGAGPPRHGRGTGARAGTFASNPLSVANKYAARVKGIRPLKKPDVVKPVPGQTSMFEAPLSAELPAPTHDVPFGVTSPGQTLPTGKDWHIKALDEIGIAPAAQKPKAAKPEAPQVASQPLQKMFTPPRNLKAIPHAELVRLHRQGDKPVTAFLWEKIQPSIEYMKKKFPNYTNAIDRLVSKREGEDGSPLPGTFEIAADSYDPTKLGAKSGKPASFSTHHGQVLYKYIKQYVARHPYDTDTTPDTGIGEFGQEKAESQFREIADPREQQSDDEWQAIEQQRERKEPEILVDPRSTVKDASGQLRTASFRRGEGDRPLASDEEILRAANPQGRAQKAAVLNLEAKIVKDHLAKRSPEDRWIMQGHLSGMSPEHIAAVLSIPKGTDLKKEAANNAALQHVIRTRSLRKILNDNFRSRLFGMLAFKEPGKRHSYPLHKTVASQIQNIINELSRGIPGAQKISESRSDDDAAVKFAEDVIRAINSPAPSQQASQPVSTTQWPPKIPAKLAAKGKRKVKQAPGQTTMQFQLESKNALTAPAEQLQFIPDRPTGHPAPPKQPPLEGNERWALHTGESSDINELKKLNAIATKRGLIFKVKVPPASPFGKQQMESIRWFTFTPAKWKERFVQRGNPEKYGLASFTSPRPGYGGLGKPSGQKAPSGGSGALGAFVAGLVGGRRGGAGLARAFAPPKPATQPAAPKAPPKPRALTAAEADRLGNEMSQQQISDARARSRVTETPGGMWWINYPDLSTEANEGKKAAVKPPKAGKAAAQVRSPEDAAREEQTRRDNAIAKSLRAKQSRERAEAIERGEKPARSRSGSGEKTKVVLPEEFKVTKVLGSSPPIPEGQKIPMAVGHKTEIYADDFQPVEAYYAVTDLKNLVPSHVIDADSRITPNPAYKHTSAQPRNYAPGSANHDKVLRHLSQQRHRYWTTDNPDPVAGPATIDEQGQVSNANGRTATALYAAAKELSGHAGAYDWLRKAVIESAPKFGIPSEEAAKHQFPILVRVTPTIRAGTKEFHELARAGNRRTQQVEDPVGEAASMADKVAPDDVLTDLQKKELISSDKPLSAILSDKNHPLVKRLFSEVKNSADVNTYFDDDGNLHGEGRNRAENVLLAKFITDVPLLRKADYQFKSFKNAIGDALPSIMRIGEPIKKPLEAAVRYVVSHPQVKSYQHFLDDVSQKRAFETGTEADPIARSLLEALYKTKELTRSKKSWNSLAIRNMFAQMAAAASHRTQAASGRSLLSPTQTSLSEDLIDAIQQGSSEASLRRAAVAQAHQDADRGVDESETEEGKELVSPAAPVATKPKPAKPKPPTLFSSRHHDATRDLYTAVHANYYHKTTFPPHRVARKNSAPKKSKAH